MSRGGGCRAAVLCARRLPTGTDRLRMGRPTKPFNQSPAPSAAERKARTRFGATICPTSPEAY